MTVLQELIKKWEDEYENGDSEQESYMKFIKDAKGLIAIEKHQIAHAYELGFIEELQEAFKTGKEFYESVYENPNE